MMSEKKRKTKARHPTARTPEELGKILGLSKGDIALMEHKAELSRIAAAAIRQSGLRVNELAELSGVARSKVSAVKNGATVSVSCDLLIKIVGATGSRLRLKAA
jgi:predicted XRE-type DNA-binding protein